MRRIFILALLATWALPAATQIVTVKSAFGTDSAMLGEQLEYMITVQSAPDVQVQLPALSDTLTQAIEIVEDFPADTVFEDEKRLLTKKYRVTSFEPGWNTVPPLPVRFQHEAITDTIYTTVQLLTVLTPAVDTTQAIRPIKPPVNTPVTLAEVLPWMLGGYGVFLLATLVAALIWIRARKKEDPGIFATAPPEPPHIEAFQSLSRLRAERLPQKGQVKEYYSRLTRIVRHYMARQFGIHALESTTAEILEAFATQNSGEKELLEMLDKLLNLADLVKFAREDPTPQENELHIDHAEGFVQQTYRMFYTDEEEADAEGNQERGDEDAGHAADGEKDVEPVKLEERNG